MARYRKRPIEVDAVQWTGENAAEVAAFLGLPADPNWPVAPTIAIKTAHGDVAYVRPGDWIIPDSEPGTFYPVKPDVFDATYEPAG